MRAAVTAALLVVCCAARAADAMAFVSACRTTAKDPNVAAGAVFALVHQVGEPATVLYEVSTARVVTLAWLRPPSAATRNEEDFEAEGGMRSSARASDVIAYLRRQPFRFVTDWKASLKTTGAALPACAIEYRVLGGYDRRH